MTHFFEESKKYGLLNTFFSFFSRLRHKVIFLTFLTRKAISLVAKHVCILFKDIRNAYKRLWRPLRQKNSLVQKLIFCTRSFKAAIEQVALPWQYWQTKIMHISSLLDGSTTQTLQ